MNIPGRIVSNSQFYIQKDGDRLILKPIASQRWQKFADKESGEIFASCATVLKAPPATCRALMAHCEAHPDHFTTLSEQIGVAADGLAYALRGEGTQEAPREKVTEYCVTFELNFMLVMPFRSTPS